MLAKRYGELRLPVGPFRLNIHDYPLIVVTLVAAVLRTFQPGWNQLIWDEVHILFNSMRLARYGEWIWLSNQTSWGGLAGHSPLSNYIVALPYVFTTDPRAARMLIAVMGVLAVVVIYLMVQRYFGTTAAFISGLMFAVAAPAVQWSRYVWNPNIALLFIALWLYTGLLGYYEGKRNARVLHWLMLSLAIQTHPAHVFLGLLSLVLLVNGWRKFGREIVCGTLLGWTLAVLSLIPWGIGLIQAGANPMESVNSAINPLPFNLNDVWETFASVVAGVDHAGLAEGHPFAGNWWPPAWAYGILWLQAGFTLVGAIGLIVYGFRAGLNGFRYRFMALVTFVPFVAFLVTPIEIVDFYMLAAMFGAFPVQGIVLAGMLRGRGRVLAGVLALMFVGMQVWMNVSTLRWLSLDGWEQPLRAPMDTMLDLADDWAEADREVIFVVDTETEKYVYSQMQVEFWQVVNQDRTSNRIVDRFLGGGVPIPRQGGLYIALEDSPTLALLPGTPQPVGLTRTGETAFQVVSVPANYLPERNFIPETISRFDNGMRILGLYAEMGPRPGQTWPVTLVWQVEDDAPERDYQFSLRVTGGGGEAVYGQHDFPSLGWQQWRVGDIVINRADVPISADFVPNTDMRVRLLAYTLVDMQNAAAIDNAGNAVAGYLNLRPQLDALDWPELQRGMP